MPKRRCLLILPLMAFLGMLPRGAQAYGTDVHFNLTYVLCKLAGMPAKDALWIAAADQSMDDNTCTTAFTNIVDWAIHHTKYRNNGKLWHVLSDAGGDMDSTNSPTPKTVRYTDGGVAARKAITERLNDLWMRVPQNPVSPDDENARIMADIALGQFLHARQDYYSHRQLAKDRSDEDDNTYLPYGTLWGHAVDGDGHTADYVAARPELAKRMIQDSYDRIAHFASTVLSPAHVQKNIPSLNLLIDTIVPCYTTEDSSFPAGKDVHIPKGNHLAFPPQAKLNSALSLCIQQHFSASWAGNPSIPAYSSALTLPYDDPKTPLKAVKDKIAAWK